MDSQATLTSEQKDLYPVYAYDGVATLPKYPTDLKLLIDGTESKGFSTGDAGEDIEYSCTFNNNYYIYENIHGLFLVSLLELCFLHNY